ncbi:hypothetical protein QL285_082106 [Trifolium repens]|nr:hypothetical protein QL285_082106 [Trifolium repens]
MTSSSALKVNACMIEIANSIPNQFAKDQRPFKFEDLQFPVEKPVDFESLKVNGFPGIKGLFEKHDLIYYLDILNGPTYTELIKEFWMKASIITRESYNDSVKRLIKEKPEFRGKSPADMGMRPFVGVEIESYVAGLRVSIRLEHIYEALKLTSDGIYLKTADSVDPEVQLFIYGKESESKSNTDLTNTSKVIYKIFIDSIAPKLGGTDQVSVIQKLFTFHVGKGNLVNTAKLMFVHLLDAIDSKKPIIHHGRLLSHMFAQSGLLDAVKPFFPGFGTYMTSAQMVNSTTLRQKRLLGKASRVFLKRKATKSPSGPRKKKAAKVTTGARKPRRQRKLLVDATEEEKAEAVDEDVLRQVADFDKREKEKEKELENSWECGVDPGEFDDMYAKLPQKNAEQTLAVQTIYKAIDNGKYPNYIVNGSVHASVLEKSTFKQPPLVPVNRVFETLIIEVDPPKDHTKPFIDFFLTKSNPFAATHTETQENSLLRSNPPSAASHLSYLFVHCFLNRKEKLPPRIVFDSHHAAGTVASAWCSFLQRLAELGRRLKVVEEIFENMDKVFSSREEDDA